MISWFCYVLLWYFTLLRDGIIMSIGILVTRSVRLWFVLFTGEFSHSMWLEYHMMTSSNENIFRVTGHLCGEFTAQGQWRGPLMLSFDLRLNKPLSKQSWGWWFETPLRPLWRHFYEHCQTRTLKQWTRWQHKDSYIHHLGRLKQSVCLLSAGHVIYSLKDSPTILFW